MNFKPKYCPRCALENTIYEYCKYRIMKLHRENIQKPCKFHKFHYFPRNLAKKSQILMLNLSY